jgi:type I restriction enzyme S subunit
LGFRKLTLIAGQASRASDLIAVLLRRLVNQALTGQLATGDRSDEPAMMQIEALAAAKKLQKAKNADRVAFGVEAMPRNVADILREAGDWLPAQEVARLYGIVSGTSTETVEPFYAELRELDVSGNLLSEPIHDDTGTKIGDRLRWRVSA